jgi:hypothetical protein
MRTVWQNSENDFTRVAFFRDTYYPGVRCEHCDSNLLSNLSAMIVVMNATAPEGVPPRRIREGKTAHAPPCPARGPEAHESSHIV